MKEERLLRLIGGIDDDLIEAAMQKPSAPVRHIRQLAAAAACLVLAAAGITAGFLFSRLPAAHKESTEYSRAEVAIESGEVSIFYVQEGEILEEPVFLEMDPQIIFAAWREKNGIGDDVVLVSCRLLGEGTEETELFDSSVIVTYTAPDSLTLELTVEGALEQYGLTDGTLLTDSLIRTMMTYTAAADDYVLHLGTSE